MTSHQYVYGIVRADHPAQLTGATGVGDPPAEPRLLIEHRVAAVVSDAPPGLRAKRRDLLGHQRVIEALHSQGAVLPMRFGMVVTSEEALRAELRREADRHLAALDAVQGRVEFNVKLFSDEDALAREIAERDPEIQRLRRPGGGSYSEQLQLGEAIATAVQRHQVAEGDHVLDELGPLAVASADGPPITGCPLNVSFLVESTDLKPFLARTEALNEELRPATRLQCTGPLPPYSFVTSME